MTSRKLRSGFTLIELVVTIAIIAILAAIAIPTYFDTTHRNKRAAAKAALSTLAQNEETYFGDHKSYASLPSLTNSTTLYVGVDGSLSTTLSGGSNYQISISPLTGSSNITACAASPSSTSALSDYLIIATPLNFQLKDSKCLTMCLASDNERGSTGSSSVADCWAK